MKPFLRKYEPDPLPEPRPAYSGPKGPTVCAEQSFASGALPVFADCEGCGHLVISHLRRPCDLCRLELRVQALEGT